MRACARSSTSGCKQNWCQPIRCHPSNCAITYYICIYLVDPLVFTCREFFCCCARIFLVAILCMSNSLLLPPPAADATNKVGDLATPNTKDKVLPPLCKTFWEDEKRVNILMVVAGSVSGAALKRSLLITQILFLTWPRSRFLVSTLHCLYPRYQILDLQDIGPF